MKSAQRKLHRAIPLVVLALAIGTVSSCSSSNGAQASGGLVTSNGTAGLVSNNAGGLVSNNAGGLVSNNAGGLISNNAGGLVSNNAGGLISNNAGGLSGSLLGPSSGLIANNAAGIIANNAGGLISNNSGGLVSNNAGGLVSNNAGGLISNNSGGLVSNNAGGYSVLAATPSLTSPAAGATVHLVNELGDEISDDVVADASGHYAFSQVRPSGPLVFVKAVYQAEGHTVSLAAAAGAPRDAGTKQVNVDPGTTIVSKKVGEMARGGVAPVDAVAPDTLAKLATAVNASLTPKGVVAASILPEAQAAKAFDGMLQENPTFSKTIHEIVATAGTTTNLLNKTPDLPPNPKDPIGIVAARPVTVTTYAGTGAAGDLGGARASAQFRGPAAVARDNAGNLFVAEANGNRIRRIAATGETTIFAGDGANVAADSSATGAAPASHPAKFNRPGAIAVDTSGNVFVADTGSQTIRQIDAAGNVTTIAGDGIAGNTDGPGATARFNGPSGITLDGAGALYVADGNNNTIRKVMLNDPMHPVTTLAGSSAGYADGVAATALFYSPESLAFDGKGSLLITDRQNFRVRRLSLADGLVSTVAGTGKAGYQDGIASEAQFMSPSGVAVDGSGNIYVTDIGGQRIRLITPDGNVATLAGTGLPGFGDGGGKAASFNAPMHLTCDAAGVLYIPDYFNELIRKVK